MSPPTPVIPITDTERIGKLEQAVGDVWKKFAIHEQRIKDHGDALTKVADAEKAAEEHLKLVEQNSLSTKLGKGLSAAVGIAKAVPGAILSWSIAAIKKSAPVAAGVLLTLALTGNLTNPGCTPVVPDPPPTPVPPIPPVPPVPPTPIPLAGFRVVMSYDKAALSEDQKAIVYGREVRDYLELKAVIDTDSKDKAYWIIASGSNVSGAPGWVRDVWQKHPGSTSWMVISNGKTGYDGPIPKDKAAAMAMLKQYGDVVPASHRSDSALQTKPVTPLKR